MGARLQQALLGSVGDTCERSGLRNSANVANWDVLLYHVRGNLEVPLAMPMGLLPPQNLAPRSIACDESLSLPSMASAPTG